MRCVSSRRPGRILVYGFVGLLAATLPSQVFAQSRSGGSTGGSSSLGGGGGSSMSGSVLGGGSSSLGGGSGSGTSFSGGSSGTGSSLSGSGGTGILGTTSTLSALGNTTQGSGQGRSGLTTEATSEGVSPSNPFSSDYAEAMAAG